MKPGLQLQLPTVFHHLGCGLFPREESQEPWRLFRHAGFGQNQTDRSRTLPARSCRIGACCTGAINERAFALPIEVADLHAGAKRQPGCHRDAKELPIVRNPHIPAHAAPPAIIAFGAKALSGYRPERVRDFSFL